MNIISKTIFLFFLIFNHFLAFAQRDEEHLVPYRSAANPHYWKHNPPSASYWQQDVHYEIKATIDDSANVIIGNEYKLTYYNNSPDTLHEMYFHLFQNAFQPGSYYHDLNKNNDIKVKFGQYEAQGLGTVVEDLRVNGLLVQTILDNTVLQVRLNTPLLPADSLVVTCKFKTYFDSGTMRRRMAAFETFGYKHYNGVHWYPAVTVYDRKFGWSTDQHLDKEFYNNFGQFDIELTFPQEYIVEATGVLVNREEVMPDSLRTKLDMKNFADKPFNEAPSIIIPREKGKTKTWRYHAINVHNFAFTADPTYRIDEVVWNGVKVIALAQEPHAGKWQESAEFTAVIIRIYSTDFGMYDWPKVIVADAKDGMEYPMLTLDGGTYPQHQGLLAHEVGHMWFYGMVANNETYRASMDEGFTQFLTVWSMDKLLGGKRARTGKTKYITKYLAPYDVRYESLYYPYLNHVVEGYDERLNQHSSEFNGAIRHGGNYGLVYYKTGTMLYNLRYVLGDELFLKAMQYYVEKWKFAHPYPEDFRQAIIEYTKADLNWFFDQWLETDKYIDYGIKNVKKVNKENEYEITFVRKGKMRMPVEFTITTIDSQQVHYLIPNTWFVKNTTATVLPKWYGWDLLQPTYTARIKAPAELLTVEIDPDHYMADMDLRDNKVGKGGISTWQFEHHVPSIPSWEKQRNYWRPDLWYNNFDGLQAGLSIKGNYFKQSTYSAIGWLNTGVLQNDIPEAEENRHQWVAFDLNHRHSLRKVWRNLDASEQAYYNAGIWKLQAGLEKVFQKQDQRNPEYSRLFLNAKYLINEETYRRYLLYPRFWGAAEKETSYVNSSINFGYFRNYAYTKGTGNFTISVRVPSVRSDFNYSYINLESINRINGKKLEFRSRVFGQWGYGNFPLESALYLASANPEELINYRITRAVGIVPSEWATYGADINHFHEGGGLNLRGYSGYIAPEIVKGPSGNDSTVFGFVGKTGASWSGELEFDKLVKIPAKGLTKNLKLDTYLFTDVGMLAFDVDSKLNLGSLRMDAGIGTALTIRFSPYDLKPVVVRFDVPLFLNRPPSDSDYIAFRYVLGIRRAF